MNGRSYFEDMKPKQEKRDLSILIPFQGNNHDVGDGQSSIDRDSIIQAAHQSFMIEDYDGRSISGSNDSFKKRLKGEWRQSLSSVNTLSVNHYEQNDNCTNYVLDKSLELRAEKVLKDQKLYHNQVNVKTVDVTIENELNSLTERDKLPFKKSFNDYDEESQQLINECVTSESSDGSITLKSNRNQDFHRSTINDGDMSPRHENEPVNDDNTYRHFKSMSDASLLYEDCITPLISKLATTECQGLSESEHAITDGDHSWISSLPDVITYLDCQHLDSHELKEPKQSQPNHHCNTFAYATESGNTNHSSNSRTVSIDSTQLSSFKIIGVPNNHLLQTNGQRNDQKN